MGDIVSESTGDFISVRLGDFVGIRTPVPILSRTTIAAGLISAKVHKSSAGETGASRRDKNEPQLRGAMGKSWGPTALPTWGWASGKPGSRRDVPVAAPAANGLAASIVLAVGTAIAATIAPAIVTVVVLMVIMVCGPRTRVRDRIGSEGGR